MHVYPGKSHRRTSFGHSQLQQEHQSSLCEKKSVSVCLFINYCALNHNQYHLPLTLELLDHLLSARIVTKLDLQGAYNLVRIRLGDK